MKNVFVKYNPYSVTTEIKIDGKVVKQSSSLNISKGTRLQEVVDNLPSILKEEEMDYEYNIEFIGTKADFDDLKNAFDKDDSIDIKYQFREIPSVDEAEKIIDRIFDEIKNSPYSELKTSEIIAAFEKAKSPDFEVNVVATMSSGKSTLINAFLGAKLMPVANEATTAKIVKIENDDNAKEYSAIVLDKNGKKIAERNPVRLKDMKEFNKDENASEILLKGNIPFVKNSKVKLILNDTPGPNNSQNEDHRKKTYDMLENSEQSVVLYIMNYTQMRTDDDAIFLGEVSEKMKKRGKFSKDRFIFVVNKFDSIAIDDDGDVAEALNKQVEYLCNHKITNANIFPVSAAAAYEIRAGVTPEESVDTLSIFAKKVSKYPDYFNFSSYNNFSHLNGKVMAKINDDLSRADRMQRLEICSGITAIEEAIKLYIDKYAMAIKINDLLNSFNGSVKALDLKAKIERELMSNKEKARQYETEIQKIQKKIEGGNKVKQISESINQKSFIKSFIDEMKKQTASIDTEFNRIISNANDTVKRAEANTMIRVLEFKVKNLIAKLQSDASNEFAKTVKAEFDQIINEYKKSLLAIGKDTKIGDLSIDLSVLANVDSQVKFAITNNYSHIVDEGHNESRQRTIRVPGGFFRKTFSILTFGMVNDYTEKVETYTVHIANNVEYIRWKQLINNTVKPLQVNLAKVISQIITQAESEVATMKGSLKEEFDRINKFVLNELETQKTIAQKQKATEQDIKKNRDKSAWLEQIQTRIESINNPK